jgi:hypothetical protein
MAWDVAQFRYCADQFGKHAFALPHLRFDETLWLIVVHDMDDGKFRCLCSSQLTSSA